MQASTPDLQLVCNHNYACELRSGLPPPESLCHVEGRQHSEHERESDHQPDKCWHDHLDPEETRLRHHNETTDHENISQKHAPSKEARKKQLIGVQHNANDTIGATNRLSGTITRSSLGDPPRKRRRCWSSELHQRFLNALQQLGGPEVATPKQVREVMDEEGLTNDEVKSHLQKYRLHMRRVPISASQEQRPRLLLFGGVWSSNSENGNRTADHESAFQQASELYDRSVQSSGPLLPPCQPHEFLPNLSNVEVSRASSKDQSQLVCHKSIKEEEEKSIQRREKSLDQTEGTNTSNSVSLNDHGQEGSKAGNMYRKRLQGPQRTNMKASISTARRQLSNNTNRQQENSGDETCSSGRYTKEDIQVHVMSGLVWGRNAQLHEDDDDEHASIGGPQDITELKIGCNAS